MKAAIFFLSAVAACALGASPVPDPASTVIWGAARFTVLTDGLIRMEALREATPPGVNAPAAEFDDRPTLVIQNRRTAKVPNFLVSFPNATAVKISTARVVLVHDTGGYVPPGAGCSSSQWRNDTDQVGGSRVAAFPNGTSARDAGGCCALCNRTSECTSWVFAPDAGLCYLMRGVTGSRHREGRVAGGALSSSPVFSPATLSVTNSLGSVWRPGTDIPGVLRGSVRGDFSCSNNEAIGKCAEAVGERVEDSILSTSGWGLHDDTASTRRQTGAGAQSGAGVTWFNTTSVLSADWYLFAFETHLEQQPLALAGALADFAAVAGRPSMPPRSALGVWWSHYYPFSQDEYEAQVLGGYRQHGLPLNHAVLDLAWHIRNVPAPCNGYGGLIWNETLFNGDANAFLTSLEAGTSAYGLPLSFLGNLHIQKGVDVCQGPAFRELARRLGRDPSSNATIPCGLGDPVFAQGLFELFLDPAPPTGSGAWPYRWTDYGGCDGLPTPREQMLWNSILFGGHIRATSQLRPMVLTRNGGRGVHRTPVFFTGDTEQCYGTLAYQVKYTSSNANDLVGYTSHDIGGFKEDKDGGPGCVGSWQAGNNTQGALYLRWLQWGAFSPVMRTHCTMCVGRDTFAPCTYCERRVWEWPDLYPAMKDTMTLRNAIVPHLYSLARRFYETALAAVRPAYVTWPGEPRAYDTADTQYMIGSDIVAAPVTAEAPDRAEQEAVVAREGRAGRPLLATAGAAVTQSVWLPPSRQWASWSGAAFHPGNTTVTASYGLAEVPVFAAVGAVVPMRTFADRANDASSADPAVWTVWAPKGAAGSGTGELYEDDGSTRDYEAPPGQPVPNCTTACATTAALATVTGSSAAVTVGPTLGTFQGQKASRRHEVHVRGGSGRTVASVTLAGEPVARCSAGSGADDGPCWTTVSGTAASVLTSPEGTVVVRSGAAIPSASGLAVVVTFA